MIEPELKLITKPGEEFDRAMDIYEDSFPEDERVPRSGFLGALRRGPGSGGPSMDLFWSIRHKGELVGMAFLTCHRSSQVLFFVYVAVASPRRGLFPARLLMKRIMEKSVETCRAERVEILGAIFEVERVQDAQSSLDAEFRRKRLALFKSLGAVLLSDGYVQPALREGGNPVPLNLMFLPLQSGWSADALIKGFYKAEFALSEEHPYVIKALSRAAQAGD